MFDGFEEEGGRNLRFVGGGAVYDAGGREGVFDCEGFGEGVIGDVWRGVVGVV